MREGRPIHKFPEMFKGSQPTDGTHLILTQEEKDKLISVRAIRKMD